ncbi:LysR family transcriptional regulator [Pseudohalocynthiibacter aestuariivivens]|uniref:LysR family transcriptional regulator n=1 Tax=Roseovarius pelagicus TaxID=2980108 RepID=A0ABY6DES6_9RHOB|nr:MULTISPECIES: LysR family transcriptional regulator [Rhodobacterales]QIE46873.1 LysR family transcriptional regulator [Pseudohalocynthiibacter aestuariivivens]UXX84580.1 LysR family transcriptional regulator [Roseovarius pelagicus]
MDWHSLPPLTALRAFAALAEAGSASAAGARLNVSHAAISQQVKALESHIGLALVDRSGRALALTAEGEALAVSLADGFGVIAQTVAQLTGADAERPLQVSTTPQFAANWLMPRLRDFQTRHPGIDLMVNPSPVRADPTPGGIDLGVRFGKGVWSGLDAELLVPTDIVVVAAPSLVGDRVFERASDLLEFPWLDELEALQAQDWLYSAGVTEGRAKSVTMLPGNLMLEGARDGQGIAVLTAKWVERDVAAGTLRILFRDKGDTGYFIVTRPGVMRPPARTFVRWLRRHRDDGALEIGHDVGLHG